MRVALAAYLHDGLRAVPGLGSSECLGRWPQPTVDLKLARDRVVCAVMESGAPKEGTRIGGPIVQRVTPGVAPSAIVRLDWDEVEQDFSIGVWADSDALRDDTDEILHELLNVPYWETCPPVASTTLAAAVASVGRQVVVPASMSGIWPRTRLSVGAAVEVVEVEDITPTGFLATFRSTHASGAALVEVAARRELAAEGLFLRCSDHLDAVARFDCEGAHPFDDAAQGAGVQRQEFRSVRRGVGSMRHLRDVAAVLQTRLTLRSQVAPTLPTSATVPTPRSVIVFE
jgi:hypothetical protein